MTDDALSYISQMPHFSFLPSEERRRIADAAVHQAFKAGTEYAVQGKTQIDSIYIVQKGALALFDQRQGEKKAIGHIKANEVFGGITILLNGGVSLRTVIVEKDCSGYLIPQDIFLDLCTRFPDFFDYFLENFSKNIFDPAMDSLIETGQARQFLLANEPFSFLPETELDRIASHLSLVQYPSDTVILVQGRSRIGYLYILQKGSAKRYFDHPDAKNVNQYMTEGDSYGGISMLLNDSISLRTVKVVEKSYFYLLPKNVFLELCKQYESFTEYFTDTFGKRMLQKSYAAIVAKTMVPKEEGLMFLNQHVASLYTPQPLFVETATSIREAANMMTRKEISSLLVKTPDGECVGMVTERDLVRRVLAEGRPIDDPITAIMSSPVRTVPEHALILEALLSMMENDIRHLAVTDSDDQVIGIMSNRDLISAQGQSPLFMLRQVSSAGTIEEIIEAHHRLPHLIRALITGGAKANNITRFITTFSDAVLKKVMAFTVEQLGKPPVPFVFMILGSEGRSEQTLKTDQDNAIIFQDVPEKDLPDIRAYFLKFGQTACTMLDTAGYDFCKGGVMAQNPKWCQPLSVWQDYFSQWIHAATPDDLLQASIFFDFRKGWGDDTFIDKLRTHLFQSLGGWSGFFRHLTENALHFKPPIGFFRNFVVESKGEHRSKFDIKAAMTPIVDFARIFALNNKIEETNTLERLGHLRIKEVLTNEEYEEIEKAYSFMMQLRFARQITAVLDEKIKPDNYINPKKLTRIEQKMLKEIFIRIEKFQTKLEFKFIGIV